MYTHFSPCSYDSAATIQRWLNESMLEIRTTCSTIACCKVCSSSNIRVAICNVMDHTITATREESSAVQFQFDCQPSLSRRCCSRVLNMLQVHNQSTMPPAPLGHHFLVESLLSRRFIALYPSIFRAQFLCVQPAHHFTCECGLSFSFRKPRTIYLRWAGNDLSNLRILWRCGSESLLLMLGIQQTSHS